MKKSITALLLVLTMILTSAVPAFAATSGTEGNMTWSLNGGVLTISGSGPMPEMGANRYPWSDYFEDITSIVVNEGITKISSYAFANCQETSVSLPSTLKEIGQAAFFCDGMLQSVAIPEGVEVIGTEAFYENFSLKTVNIPASVKDLGIYPFARCTTLENINVAAGNTKWKFSDDLLMSKDGKFVNGAIYKKGGTFVIPEGVETIGNEAFYTSGITELVLPSTLKSIAPQALNICKNLKVLDVPKNVIYMGDFCFGFRSFNGNLMDGLTIKCVKGSAAEQYAKANGINVEIKSGTAPAIHSKHTYTTKVIKKASITAGGIKQKKCSVCGVEELINTSKLTPSISLSSTKKTITKGKSYTLTVTYKNGDGVKSVTSSSKSIATATKTSTGKYKIKALKKGKATITVKLKSGLSKKLYVTVS